MYFRVLVSAALVSLLLVSFAGASFVEDEDDSLSQVENVEQRHFKWRKCVNSKCDPGFYCRRRWCYPKRTCSVHAHCRMNSHCDFKDHVCKPGQQVCKTDRNCRSYYMYCKDGVCVKKECVRHSQCPSGKICARPGVCKPYVQKCTKHRDCRIAGFICMEGNCRKRECYYSHHCSYGHKCVQGICKLRRGYCKAEANCKQNQCCQRKWKSNIGVCRRLRQSGYWCDTKGKHTCPCVEGYTCERSYYYWGKCVKAPTTAPTEEPGSGSGAYAY